MSRGCARRTCGSSDRPTWPSEGFGKPQTTSCPRDTPVYSPAGRLPHIPRDLSTAVTFALELIHTQVRPCSPNENGKARNHVANEPVHPWMPHPRVQPCQEKAVSPERVRGDKVMMKPPDLIQNEVSRAGQSCSRAPGACLGAGQAQSRGWRMLLL